MAFSLGPVPPGVEEIRAESEAKVAFHDPATGATISVQAQCGLDAQDAPLRALTAHLLIQMSKREVTSERELTIDHRAALETEVSAEVDGVRRHFVIVVLRKDECVFDLLHIDSGADDPRLEKSREAFRQMAYGFQTVE